MFEGQTDYRVNVAARRPPWIGYWQKSCLVGNLLGTGDLTAMLRSTVVVAISVAAWVTPSLAQEGPGGDALAAYVDSLERITTADALDRIEPRWNPAVHYFPVVFGRLRLGFYQLRAAQLSGDIADYEHALETFERATIEAPSQPEAWYAFGLTNIDMRRREFSDRRVTQQHMSGYTRYYLGGREALLQSLAVEPEFMPSLELLLEIVVEEGDRVQPAGVLAAMRTAARLMPDDPRPLLVLGRGDRKEGKLDEALARFQQYGAVGGDPGVARLEASRTLFALDRTDEAVSAYWSGLKYPGPRGRALYRTDLSWVAIQSEISAFDRLEVDSLNTWVTDFWANRDAESVRPTGDRIREHLRRWVLVHRQFRVSRPEGRAPSNPPWLFERPLACTDGRDRSLDGVDFLNPSRPKDLRGWEPFLDNRAPIYMRHGEPIRRVWSNANAAGGFDPLAVPTLVPGTVARAGFADIEVPATPHDFLARSANLGSVGVLDRGRAAVLFLCWLCSPRLRSADDVVVQGADQAVRMVLVRDGSPSRFLRQLRQPSSTGPGPLAPRCVSARSRPFPGVTQYPLHAFVSAVAPALRVGYGSRGTHRRLRPVLSRQPVSDDTSLRATGTPSHRRRNHSGGLLGSTRKPDRRESTRQFASCLPTFPGLGP